MLIPSHLWALQLLQALQFRFCISGRVKISDKSASQAGAFVLSLLSSAGGITETHMIYVNDAVFAFPMALHGKGDQRPAWNAANGICLDSATTAGSPAGVDTTAAAAATML